jgi:hypothetical protein
MVVWGNDPPSTMLLSDNALTDPVDMIANKPMNNKNKNLKPFVL